MLGVAPLYILYTLILAFFRSKTFAGNPATGIETNSRLEGFRLDCSSSDTGRAFLSSNYKSVGATLVTCIRSTSNSVG